MPWYEFVLKKFAYYRERNHQDKEQWYHTRFIAYRIAIINHSKPDPTWFGRGGLNRFLPLDDIDQSKVKVNEEARQRILHEYEQYLLIKNSKK